MRSVFVAVLALVGCSKGNSGVETALGTTGATIRLPKGWKVVDTGKFGGKHDSWNIEFGESSSSDYRLVSCRTMAEAPTLDDFYSQSEDSCKNATKAGTKRTLDSGAYYVECDRSDTFHVGAAIRIATADGGLDERDTFVHCISNSSSPTEDHYTIVKSLRTK